MALQLIASGFVDTCVKWVFMLCPGPNLSKRIHAKYLYPYLLRGLKIVHPNQVWSVDVTYCRMKKKTFILEAIKKAIVKHGTPEIINSDQGSQFTSEGYAKLLKDHGIKISMDGKGRALDNCRIERFFRSYKWEKLYLEEYETGHQLRHITTEYIDFYNNKRPHQTLTYHTLAECYSGSYRYQLPEKAA